jgi:signal transduction histidine kinase/FixJ family two-component response regulator
VIAIVDDDEAIRHPLKAYFEEHGLSVRECVNGADLLSLLKTQTVALILLDIGLPDMDGLSLLPQIVDEYPEVSVVMLTGVADLQVALDCIRKGANDYISKPVQLDEIFHVSKKALEKRRLIFENRKYQEELEEAHFRIRLLHQLSMKMNTVYLSTVELDEILRAILVGITANEGLGFNRAFLAMFDETNGFLRGKMAIGPGCREEAGRVWQEIKEQDLNFMDLVDKFRDACESHDKAVNQIVRNLNIPVNDTANILIKCALDRRSIKVSPENGCVPIPLERRHFYGKVEGADYPYERRGLRGKELGTALAVPHDLIQLFGEDYFVVVPLFSPGRSFGVIIADNYVTRRPILNTHVNALELFASQASLAVEQSHLYVEMQKKIAELEALNQELDKSKDLLVESERYSALGHMAAQLVHIIRNPITSIGGISRILSKKTNDESWQKYLSVIIKETERVESTLEDLFDFVAYSEPQKETVPVCSTIRKTLMLVQNLLTKHKVGWQVDCPSPEPEVLADLRQVRQVFLHLIKNAIEAMPDGGKLFLGVKVEDNLVHVVIRDTGSGILATHLDQAKTPFFTTKTYGTGMGLTLVERVLKAHNGSFSLRSHEGNGTEAHVVLPMQ